MPSNNVSYLTVGPITAASANNIATSQTPGAAGNLTLNGTTVSGGVATLDTPRKVLLTYAADEHTKTVTLYGTDRQGRVISESITPPSSAGTSTSILDYATVTRIAVSAAFAGAVTVGTTSSLSSPWFPLSLRTEPFNANLALEFAAGTTATAEVEYTPDDIQDLSVTNPAVFADATLTGKTSNASKNLTEAWRACRFTLTGFTTGSVTLAIIQPRHK